MRDPLNRDRVLRAAVALADGSGIDALSMRTLAQEFSIHGCGAFVHAG